MIANKINQFFEVRKQFPGSNVVLSVSDSSVSETLIRVSSADGENVVVGFNEVVLTQKGLLNNLESLAYSEEFTQCGAYRCTTVSGQELVQKIVGELVAMVFAQSPDSLQYEIMVDGELVADNVVVVPNAVAAPRKSKVNPFVYVGALGAAVLLAVLLFVFIGGGTKTFKGKNVLFSPINDPVCHSMYNFAEEFDKGYIPALENTFSDCDVTIKYNSKNDVVMSIVVTNNDTGNLVYERSLEPKGLDFYSVNIKYYDPYANILQIDCSGDVNDYRTETETNRSKVTYENCLDNQDLSYVHGEMGFFDGTYTTKSIKADGEPGQLTVTDYWPNNQAKLVRSYTANDEGKWKIKEACNYKEDGTEGNPIEVYSLLKGRWIGFSCNLVQTWSQEPVYLILRPSKDDWSKGRAFVCCSRSACKNDYRYMQKGQYSIDEDGYIKLHSMKDSGGRKCDVKRLKISGTSSRITLSGKFDNNSSTFVSDLNVNSRSWFKKSIQSKYKVY